MSAPPLPPPPSSGFSAQNNGGQLIALRALRVGQVDDTFGKSTDGSGKVSAVYLDVWVLTGPQTGAYYSDTPNQSRLGRQFQPVAGNGETYYGRVKPEKAGSGTSYILAETWPGDEQFINQHRAAMANGGGQQSQQSQQPQHQYQNEPDWQRAIPPQQQTYVQQPQQQQTYPQQPPQPEGPPMPPAAPPSYGPPQGNSNDKPPF